jgi:Glycosyl transferase family 2
MKPVTAAIAYSPDPRFETLLSSLVASPLVERVVVAADDRADLRRREANCEVLIGWLYSGDTLERLLDSTRTEYLLLLPTACDLSFEPGGIERLVRVGETSRAGVVYSDFYALGSLGKTLRPLNDYQEGSVRDTFDFGALMLYSVSAMREAGQRQGPLPPVRFAGLYALRLRVSLLRPILHVPEPLYSVGQEGGHSDGQGMFAYCDPKNAPAQKEMESVFTAYLRNIGAYVAPDLLKVVPPDPAHFACEASVIIPVRNRRETVGDAVRSALSQETDFPFNVIVVDNHSTDGTTEVLADLAQRFPGLTHMLPQRTDLGIGGCWNEALYGEACGRYAVQLDSDDLYATAGTLERLVNMLREGRYGMVIGAYTLVDSSLREIEPGLIDHREWSDENGHNNALRVNGLGAPRAYQTALMRGIGFLNVSYGEDYAAALHICGKFKVGRIYESLYLCRRWTGNTDSNLSVDAANRNDAFKDGVRTDEIRRRRRACGGTC